MDVEHRKMNKTAATLWFAVVAVAVAGGLFWYAQHKQTARIDRNEHKIEQVVAQLARDNARLLKADRATQINRYYGCLGGELILARFDVKLALIREFIKDAALTRKQQATLEAAAGRAALDRKAAAMYAREAAGLTPFKADPQRCARLKPSGVVVPTVPPIR